MIKVFFIVGSSVRTSPEFFEFLLNETLLVIAGGALAKLGSNDTDFETISGLALLVG
jgi:hypothetical protein